jgi:hypothetical protein
MDPERLLRYIFAIAVVVAFLCFAIVLIVALGV